MEINPVVVMPDPNYQRENAFAYCQTCKGPIFGGELIVSYLGRNGETLYVHRFTTWCEFYKNQEKEFAEMAGIQV